MYNEVELKLCPEQSGALRTKPHHDITSRLKTSRGSGIENKKPIHLSTPLPLDFQLKEKQENTGSGADKHGSFFQLLLSFLRTSRGAFRHLPSSFRSRSWIGTSIALRRAGFFREPELGCDPRRLEER